MNTNIKEKLNTVIQAIASNLFVFYVFAVITFSSCSTTPTISLTNTLSIFLLNNGKDNFLCIPIQYIGDYHIGSFEFDNGSVLFGSYEIPLKNNELNIYVYLNKTTDETGNSIGDFDLIYSEEKGNVLISKMNEPLAAKYETDYLMNQYNIYIEKYLSKNEMQKIINQYEKGNVNSRFSVWYNITLDNEKQPGNGMMGDFILNNEFNHDAVRIFPHFQHFADKYF